ncbi:MAG: hypothetical protein DHS20C11_29920 [Lysobacteraceae bacterium]|nr:MAG: hypothetical protein DHS20C11_29920 [Xanthomonadaceae bacterium]
MSDGKKQTILFADVCRSTQLFEQFGDETAHRIIDRILSMLGQVAQSNCGRVIKTIGDEIMVTFPSAIEGVEAAIGMQQAVSSDIELSREQIAIRVGLHCGKALDRDGDVYGDAVNVSARMAGLAKREQIVTTASTIEQFPLGSAIRTRELGKTRVRGKLLPIEIVDVQWQEDTSNVTLVSRAIHLDIPESNHVMQLKLGALSFVVKETSPPILLGRDQNSDVIVEAAWVSRNHAMIEFRKGNFILTDRSTNGTYVQTHDGDQIHIHRDELLLRQSGKISPGKAVPEAPADVVILYEDCPG